MPVFQGHPRQRRGDAAHEGLGRVRGEELGGHLSLIIARGEQGALWGGLIPPPRRGQSINGNWAAQAVV